MQLRRTVSLTIGGVWGDEPDGIYDLTVVRVADFDMESLTAGRMVPTQRRIDPGQRGRRLLREGDLLLEKSGGGEKQNVGRVVQWTGEHAAVCSNFVNVLRPTDRCDSRYLAYLHRSLYGRGWPNACTKQTTGIQNLDVGAYLRVAVPELRRDAQRLIADFLDRECARVDKVLRCQTSLAPLVSERRERHLDALLFGSAEGPAWFGELPVGWSAIPLRALAAGHPPTFTDGDWVEAPFIVDEGIRLIQTGNVGRGRFVDQGFRFITSETFDKLNCTEVRAGDVLLSRLSPPVGRACLCPDLETRMIASVDVAILRPDVDRIDPSWLIALCSSNRYFTWLDLESRGTTMPRVSRSQLGRVTIPVPPRGHQRRVAEAWRSTTSLERQAIQRGECMGDALAAYRYSLIHEAVTGKLDVTAASDRQMDERLHAAAENRLDEVAV
jgi:type I restriction enzyme S subunit